MSNNFFPTLIDILRFKGKPSSLPYSVNTLLATIVLAILTAAAIKGANFVKNPIAFNAVFVFVQAGLYYLILRAHNMSNRFVQCATAIFSATTFFQVISYLLSFAALHGLILLLTIWSITVSVYITKVTLESSIGKAIFICVGIQICAGVALHMAFPETFENIKELMLQNQATASAK